MEEGKITVVEGRQERMGGGKHNRNALSQVFELSRKINKNYEKKHCLIGIH